MSAPAPAPAPERVSPAWLALREPADAAARSTALVAAVRALLPAGAPARIHDLGGGTGTVGRWLAPLLCGPQQWVIHDRDADLLAIAAGDPPDAAADGSDVSVETRLGDIALLCPADLAGSSLVTASALLDVLTAEQVMRIVTSCVAAGCPALLALSVTGRVTLAPADPLDNVIGAAFNAHQRRLSAAGRLLGPDAVDAVADAFRRLGAQVRIAPSPWRLGAAGSADAALLTEWLAGWIGAACEQRPELFGAARRYQQRRRAEIAAGTLQVIVQHADLLAVPR